MLYFDPFYLFNCSSDEISSLFEFTKLEEVNGSSDEGEVHTGLYLWSTFEPLESGGELFKSLIADSQVVHGDIVVLIQ